MRVKKQVTHQQSGAALVMVVGLVALMITLIGAIQYEVARTLSYVKDIRIRGDAEKMAEVGLSAALILLRYDFEEDQRNNVKLDYYFKPDDDDPLAELSSFANAAELWSLFSKFGTNPMAILMGEDAEQTDGAAPAMMIPFGQGGVELSIEDESAKWNVHRLYTKQGIKMSDPEVNAAINGMYYMLGDRHLATEIVAALIDWMDHDNEPVDPKGAEKFDYLELPAPYLPRNGPFHDVEELRAVMGIDEQTYAVLLSAVTVWPNDLAINRDYKLNVNTATPEALAFLHKDMGEDVIDKIIEDRKNGHFKRDSDFRAVLERNGAASMFEDNDPNTSDEISARAIMSLRSKAFRVRVTGYTLDSRATLEAVIGRDIDSKGKMRVLMRRWRTLSDPEQ